MSRTGRLREPLAEAPDRQYFEERLDRGWRLVAVEWQLPDEERSGQQAAPVRREVPFGLRVADDCRHLEEDEAEMGALTTMLELISEDRPLSRVAAELNDGGHRQRGGEPWTQTAVFNLLPRLVEVAPAILATSSWRKRRRVVQNG